jgi:hypothetical protein
MECACEEDIRIAISMDQNLGELFECPVCHVPCRFTILGVGATKRQLPFWIATYKYFASGEAMRLYWQSVKRSKRVAMRLAV